MRRLKNYIYITYIPVYIVSVKEINSRTIAFKMKILINNVKYISNAIIFIKKGFYIISVPNNLHNIIL